MRFDRRETQRRPRVGLTYFASFLAFSIAWSSAVAATPGKNARISITAKNEPLQAVLLRVAKQSGANISVSPSVTGYVTVSLRGVLVRQALEAILRPLGDTWTVRDGIYLVDSSAMAPGTNPGTATLTPSVMLISTTSAARIADQLRPLFPQASIRVDSRSNAIVVIASPADLQTMRAVVQGIDVKNPTLPSTQVVTLQNGHAGDLVGQLHASFPRARIAGVGARQIVVSASPDDLAEIKSAIAALDAPLAVPTSAPVSIEAIKVSQRNPEDVARSLSRQIRGLQASVSGGTVVLTGTPDAVARAKALVAQIDVPSFNSRYTMVYRLRTVDASSVADLLRRSFRDLEVTVDTSINALAVTAPTSVQQRIADALTQIDPAPGSSGAGQGGGSGGTATELVTLRAAAPSTSGSTGPDAATAMTQALQAIVPDVKVIQLSTPGQLALVGPSPSLKIAREFIDKVDVVPPLVVLDTEILELDESVAKNLGVQLGTAVVSSTFTESTPPPNPTTGLTPALGGINSFGRTPLSFTAQLNLAVQTGKGRVLADPRISTLSGRTASIRAGDTISILTTTAGNAGTIATTQVQSFQTGVTLDITPLVDAEGGITVNLHPVVNSLAGTNNGVPEISTRDTQTTVHLQNDQTLVIGGLIQQTDTRTTNKVPILGDIPLLGHLFRNDAINGETNELVIVVTPHIVKPGDNYSPGPPLPRIGIPAALPTLPPNTLLPARSSQIVQPAIAIEPTSAAVPSQVVPTASASPSPAPAPTAFAQTNVFTFGAAPQSNFAKPGDAVQIFYATLSPTVVTNGRQVSISAISTSNVAAVRLQLGSQSISLSQTNPGEWRAVFPYAATSAPPGQSTINATLTASRSDGESAAIPIPINVSSQ